MTPTSHLKCWLLVLPTMTLGVSPLGADDIWDRRDPRYAFLFQDNRARAVGDIVTLVINETTNTNEREQRAQDKNNTASGNLTFSGNSSAGSAGAGGGGGRTGALSFNLADDFRRRFAGSAQMTSDRRFQDRIAMTVVDIMPNGNLVVEGYRSRLVAGEERVLRVTGVVRQADIGAGNAILSTSLANARISYLGRGPQSRTTNQNYFGRIVNRAWPW
jgi:flagellar L-ring protein FlgH